MTPYEALHNIERAFLEIKNFLDLGPMYHWNERRVREYIIICVLAHLFEQELQLMYRKAWQNEAGRIRQISDGAEREEKLKALTTGWFTGERIVKELRCWNTLKAEFLGKEFLSVPPPPTEVAHTLKAIGTPLAPKVTHLQDATTATATPKSMEQLQLL